MRNKNKLVGKIITLIFAILLPVMLFTPMLTFSTNSSAGGSDKSTVIAKYVTPIQVIKAQFATEEDLEVARKNLDAFEKELSKVVDGQPVNSTEAKEEALASSEEAAIFYTMYFSLEDELFVNQDGTGFLNMINQMKLYTYFSFGLIAVMAALIVILLLRCIKPQNRGFSIAGNVISIVTLLLSVASIFITIPMIFEARYSIMGQSLALTITPNPNLVICGILIVLSLITMILTLTTKGVRKNRELA